MKKVKNIIRRIYKKIYKNNPYKTRYSRSIYGKEIFKLLDEKTKKKIKKALKTYYPELSKKNKKYKKICYDLAITLENTDFNTEEYFMFNLYNKNVKQRQEFISRVHKRKYVHMLNTDDSIKLLKDKYKTYLKFKDYYKRDIIEITGKDDYKKYEEFVNKHSSFVKKNNNLSCGKSVEIIKINEENIKNVFDRILSESDSSVLEELIIQKDPMKELHPASVNTIRIITYLNDNNEVIIKYPFLKIGQNNSIVDNGGAGGILALINEKTGKVKTNGVDEKKNWYKYHPNSEITLKGFQIPDWEEACNIAINAQKDMKEARLIGWDLAYSNKGWVVIEANGHTMFIGQQIADEKGKKTEFENMINFKDENI